MASHQCRPQFSTWTCISLCVQVAQQNHDQNHHSDSSPHPSSHGHCSYCCWTSGWRNHLDTIGIVGSFSVLDVVRQCCCSDAEKFHSMHVPATGELPHCDKATSAQQACDHCMCSSLHAMTGTCKLIASVQACSKQHHSMHVQTCSLQTSVAGEERLSYVLACWA